MIPLLIALGAGTVQAQEPLSPDLLAQVRDDNLAVQKAGMTVLASWGGANLVAGGIGWAATPPGRSQAFWQGNAGWNVVNLAIAGSALASLPARRRATLDETTVRKQVRGFERALAINAGLDVGYVLAGIALQQVGRRREDPRLQGFGDALILQGGFLFAFDLTLLGASRRRSRPLR